MNRFNHEPSGITSPLQPNSSLRAEVIANFFSSRSYMEKLFATASGDGNSHLDWKLEFPSELETPEQHRQVLHKLLEQHSRLEGTDVQAHLLVKKLKDNELERCVQQALALLDNPKEKLRGSVIRKNEIGDNGGHVALSIKEET